jgi:hypothetical protein
MNEPAFPVPNDANVNSQPGLTLRQYAAIRLRVPDSGIPELDAMIRESLRDWFAGQALAGFTSSRLADGQWAVAEEAYGIADAMLARKAGAR